MLTYQNRIEQAVISHQSGEWEAAHQKYLSLLQEKPNDPVLLRYLGTLYLQTGNLAEAENILSQAVNLEPKDPTGHLNLSMVLHDTLKTELALEHADLAVTLNRSSHDALNNRAVIYQTLNRHEEALRDLQRAVKLRPVSADAWTNIGVSQSALGKSKEAETAFKRAVALDPTHSAAAVNLGVMLCKNKRYQEAIPVLRQSIKISPGFDAAHSNLARAYAMTQQLPLAEEQYQILLQAGTPSAETLGEMGELYQSEGRFVEVMEIISQLSSYPGQEAKVERWKMTLCSNIGWRKQANLHFEKCQAMAVKTDVQSLFSFAHYYGQQNQSAAADAELSQLIKLDPDDTVAHWNRSLLRLTDGRLVEGFEEYSWRFKSDGIMAERHFKQPEWCGENLNGKGILIHGEQGAGDIIQFMRYLKFVEQRGGRLLFQSGKAVWDLLAPDEDENLSQVKSPQAANTEAKIDFAVHIPLLSLPKVFKTTLETIPWEGPYVHAGEKRAAHWKDKLGENKQLRVGIVWGGNSDHKNDHNRSCRLSDFSKLATIPGIKWFSIQKGKPEGQALTPPYGMDLINLSEDIRDFSDTAAIIENLDLLISVDTSVVHLAGAMDKATWLLLPFNPDWRWLLGRSDSPWYPSLKIFRQKTFGNWASVFEQVYQSLISMVDDRSSVLSPSERKCLQALKLSQENRIQDAWALVENILQSRMELDQSCYAIIFNVAQNAGQTEKLNVLLSADQSATARKALARNAILENRPEQAEAIWHKLYVENQLDFGDVLTYLDVLIGLNRWEKTIEIMDKQVAIYANCADLKVRQGILTKQNGRAAEAIKLFEAALVFDPDCPSAVMQLAQLHIENKNYQVAVKILQQHLRCRPLDAESWQLLATIYAVQGNEDLENFYRERAEDLLSKAQLESAAI